MKLAIMLLLAASAAGLSVSPVTAQQPAAFVGPGETLLEVQAEGQVRVEPDKASLAIGIVATGTTALEATNAASAQMARITTTLKGKGISPRGIRTQQINVAPRFQRNGSSDYEGQAQITGYVARNTATVTFRQLAAASDLIAAAFGAGANSVYGPNIDREDRTAGMAEARQEAIRNARSEADDYAAGFGMRIARVVRVSERGASLQPTGEVMVTGRRIAAPAPPPPPPVAVSTPFEPGDLLRTTTLWVDFALVPK